MTESVKKKDSWIEKVDTGSVEMSGLAQVDTEQNETEASGLFMARHLPLKQIDPKSTLLKSG